MSTELTFAAATEATEPGLRRLLRDNPLTGNIHVSLEREPNAFHAAGISGDSYQLMLASGGEPRHVIASGGRFELETWINGAPRRIGYFGELRAEGGLRTRRKLLDAGEYGDASDGLYGVYGDCDVCMPEFGQCGGGADLPMTTCCAEGTYCTKKNAFYAQCLTVEPGQFVQDMR